MSYKTKCSACGAGGLIVASATLMETGEKMSLRSVLQEDGFTFDLPEGVKDGSTTDEKVVCVECFKSFDLMGTERLEEDEEKEKDFLFSIKVTAKDEAEAIAKFQDENINPADMDIEEMGSPF